MPQFEQVLSPTADGQGMSLDPKLLEMLREENVRNLPVVALSVVGPRNDAKVKLMSAVQHAIAEGAQKSRASSWGYSSSGPRQETGMETEEFGAPASRDGTRSTGMETETFGAPASRDGTQLPGMELASQPFGMGQRARETGMGSVTEPAGMGLSESSSPAGAAVWSELLPVQLSDGARAALLLLDVWGPFEDACPPQLRASALLFSAIVSSTLVVHTSARRPLQPLDDLLLLGQLAGAAQEVRHCAPLQELVLLMRDGDRVAPAGRQSDFRLLSQWVESGTDARRALSNMMDATDLYNAGDAFLFLAADQTPDDDGKADYVNMLVEQRVAKRFQDINVSSGELADYLNSVNAALNVAQCDANSIIRAIVEANQSLAVEANKAIYKQKMEELEKKWQSRTVSEEELRGTHQRAAHEAVMAFTMCKKMEGEKMNSLKAKENLQSWLREQCELRWKAIQNDIKEVEEKTPETDSSYVQLYEEQMQEALDKSPQMTLAELIKNHGTIKSDVMSKFTDGANPRHSCSQKLMELSEKLEGSFRKFANQLDQAQQEEEDAKAKESLISIAEKKAKHVYRSIMQTVRTDQIRFIHGKVQECAILTFDSTIQVLSEKERSDAHQRLKTVTDEVRDQLIQKTEGHARAEHHKHGAGVGQHAYGSERSCVDRSVHGSGGQHAYGSERSYVDRSVHGSGGGQHTFGRGRSYADTTVDETGAEAFGYQGQANDQSSKSSMMDRLPNLRFWRSN